MSIEITNLSYIYSKGGPYEKTALNNINLTVENNKFIGIIGHTGSGKSTLIQHLNGLLKPTSGKITVDGKDINEKGVNIRQIRSKVGLVFQYPEYQLFEETVYKDIEFGLKNFEFKGNIHDRIVKAVKTVGLDEALLNSSPFDLSGGQKRKAAIAGVLALEPEYLILDEPAAGLDPYGRQTVLEEIYKIHKEKKITIVLVSHSMEDISKYADLIVVMNNGEIFQKGTPSEIFSNGEELERIGLSVPEVSGIMNSIRKMGYDVPYDIFAPKEAAEFILKLTGEKNAK